MSFLNKSLIITSCLFVFGAGIGQVSALTPKEEKGVKVLKSQRLAYESPERFKPVALLEASEDIEYWKGLLPDIQDRAGDFYVVLPTLGLITPVIQVPEGTSDFTQMTQGGEIDINKYLDDGVMHYPGTAVPGEVGNSVIFGHSNFFKNGQGRYKTIFADIMNLDVGYEDEMRVFLKLDRPNSDGENYELRKFTIEKSYETVPTDVGIINPQGGKELTIFACTNGLEGRWILRGKLIENDEILVPYSFKFKYMKLVQKLQSLSEGKKQIIIEKFVEEVQKKRDTIDPTDATYTTKYKKYLLNYMRKKVEKS